MIAFTIRFIAGRYHATPWGRHVNEAAVEWPPSPWRLLRALIATWHRKLNAADWPEVRLHQLVEQLAGELPVYMLPPAIHAHTRHYMPTGGRPALIFDAFARISTSSPLVVVWPETEIEIDTSHLLDRLLENTGFLGRAESWVAVERLHTWNGQANCRPIDPSDSESAELTTISLMAPLPAADYSRWQQQTVAAIQWKNIKPHSKSTQLKTTLPGCLLDALRLETSDLQAAGWNRPPAARPVIYYRPADTFRVHYQTRPVPVSSSRTVNTVRFALGGKPLPRLEDSVKIGELLRLAVISRARYEFGSDNIPAVFSGHATARNSGHTHAFYLPEDADADGHIDHLVLYAAMGLTQAELLVLVKLQKLFTRDGQEWPVLLEAAGTAASMANTSAVLSSGCQWISATPYLHPWHRKKELSTADQIRRECAERRLPPLLTLQPLESLTVYGRLRRPVHFRRFRSKRGLTQPDRQGSFWRVAFAEPVQGPLALGFGCHFGLGLFTCDSRNLRP